MVRATLFLLAIMLLVGCSKSPPVAFHADPDDVPQKLSAWHLFRVTGGRLALNDGVVPYDLNIILFTDYAHKLRTIWMPKGVSARYRTGDALDFPVGTIISKTFYYPVVDNGARRRDEVLRTADYSRDFAGEGLDLRHVRLVETRLLVRRKSGWSAIPYVWNAGQTEATLALAGDAQAMTLTGGPKPEQFTYIVPDANQCAECHASNHTDRRIHPIGPKARHINKRYHYAGGEENQLVHLQRVGYLTGLPALETVPRDPNFANRATVDPQRMARAYLDINCGHCHNPVGAADTSGLFLTIQTQDLRRLGVCKPSVAAGKGTGNFTYDIVPGHPEQSIMIYRMSSRDPGIMMPETGRSVVHDEGVQVISRWIAAMPGSCQGGRPAPHLRQGTSATSQGL